MLTYPYSDEYLIYNYETHRYVLTAKYVREQMGVDLEKRYKFPGAVTAILDRCSDEVYDYMHEFNDSAIQDYIIAKTESGRDLIKACMRAQLTDFCVNGGLDNSIKKDERELWMSASAKRKLENNIIPEIGSVITYTGELRFCSCDKTPW